MTTPTNASATPQQIEALRRIGAAILPGTATQPSFTSADPDDEHLRRALQHLSFDAPRALAAVADGVEDAGRFLERLRAQDHPVFRSVWMVCVGAYYVNRAVWQRIDYPGRIPYPVAAGEAESFIDPSHLQAVIDRGPIYRPAPN